MDNKTILIVDDDREITELLSMFMKNQGYSAEVKFDAKSTKEWLAKNHPDLILLDIMLPDTTGIEFCRWLNSQESVKKVPVIHITGFLTDDVARKDSIVSGAKNLIYKPIDFDALKKITEMLLKNGT
ncbi:MAG: hypothetical protein A2297_00560 [Elusimicrobia bacterium RIFOXYB2_FULL_48_7]|nr:MAG: hypothetical protein A2297_00560 [Elusimicrobia bacterium RIFOXYB2_FULL_48_7]